MPYSRLHVYASFTSCGFKTPTHPYAYRVSSYTRRLVFSITYSDSHLTPSLPSLPCFRFLPFLPYYLLPSHLPSLPLTTTPSLLLPRHAHHNRPNSPPHPRLPVPPLPLEIVRFALCLAGELFPHGVIFFFFVIFVFLVGL